MKLRAATAADLPLLAELNQQLLRDEGHWRRLTLSELEARMADWLNGEYRAVIFMLEGADEAVGYALFRPDDLGIYLPQFLNTRDDRRQGLGRQAIGLLRETIWPASAVVTVEVLQTSARARAFWRAVGFGEYAITLRWPVEPARTS